MIPQAIYERMSGFAGLTSLITVSGVVNIWRDTFPPGAAFPGVVYKIIFGESLSDMKERSQLGRVLVQIDAFAESSDVADSIGEQVRLAFQQFDGISAGIHISCVDVSRYHTFFEEEASSEQINIWRVSRDFSIVHSES